MATLERRLLALETAGQGDSFPRLTLICRVGSTPMGLNLPDGALRRWPHESMEALKARARASIVKPGLAIVFECSDG